jgi:Zn-dependent peptidase ImmA (M78 family)
MKNQRNRYIQQICNAVGESEPALAISKFVSNYRHPGEEIPSICKKYGVQEILYEELPFEGGVFGEADKLVIKINRNSPPTRQKFTLAHELAHLMIASQKLKSARRSLSSAPLEIACDQVAAELLIPLSEISQLDFRNVSPSLILSLSHKFGVSLHAMALRISSLRLLRPSIGLWKWENGSSKELWYAGKRLWVTRRPHFIAFERAMESSDCIRMKDLWESPRGFHPVLIDVRRLGKDFLLALFWH